MNDRALNDRAPNDRALNDRALSDRALNDRALNEPRSPRPWLLALAGLTLGAALLLALAPETWLPVIWARSATPYLLLPAWPLTALALWRRERAAAALGGLAALGHLAWIAPALVASPPARTITDAAPLRVVAANVLYVHDAPDALGDELLATDADVLVLTEVSPRWLPFLARARARYPHHEVVVREDAFGIAVLSRHPLSRAVLVDLGEVPMIDATVATLDGPVRVLAVHTLPPVNGAYAARWRAQLTALAAYVRAIDAPLVVAGDLNATRFHAHLRAVEHAGVRDAHGALGRGLATTWPNGLFSAPPLALDHVLVSPHLVPTRVREGVGAGSDHRPVIVDLARRAPPPTPVAGLARVGARPRGPRS
ncbi:MAG: endonuclease/exonuclease/phosphatase family protein [Sandaracinaceae bacterium]|nr:endonuclease/exonuclease/phosphatase family protein [Sandaracinaceae bacterium]